MFKASPGCHEENGQRAKAEAGSPGGGHCREGHAVGGVGAWRCRCSEMKRCLLDTWLLGCQIWTSGDLVWRCNSGGFGPAPPMTTQGCRPSSAQDWGLGSPLSTSSVGCVLGSLPQPPHLPQACLSSEALASVPEAITQASPRPPAPPPTIHGRGSFHCRPQLFTENGNTLGKPQT